MKKVNIGQYYRLETKNFSVKIAQKVLKGFTDIFESHGKKTLNRPTKYVQDPGKSYVDKIFGVILNKKRTKRRGTP